MSFGLKWYNNAGSQAISTDVYGLVYIGEATWDNTTRPDYYSQVSSENYGGSPSVGTCYNYNISSSSPPTVFVSFVGPSTSGGAWGSTALCSISNTGGNNWNIVIARVGGASVAIPSVKCFAKLSGAGASGLWGIRTFDSTGGRTWDSNERMLVISRKIDWAAASDATASIVQSASLGGITSPYFMATTEAYISATRGTYTVKFDTGNMKEYTTGWSRDDAGTMFRTSNGIQLGTIYYDTADYRGYNSNNLQASRTYIIDGSKYT